MNWHNPDLYFFFCLLGFRDVAGYHLLQGRDAVDAAASGALV